MCSFVFQKILMYTNIFFQLAYCVVQFLEKDSTLTEPVSTVALLILYIC